MKRENVKYVEVFNNFSKNEKWEKRIFLEKFPDGSCLHVVKGEEENYLNYEPYCNIKKHRDLWREIAVPEYVQYDSVEDFKDSEEFMEITEELNESGEHDNFFTKVKFLCNKSKNDFDFYMENIINGIKKDIITAATQKRTSVHYTFPEETESEYIRKYFSDLGFNVENNAGFVRNTFYIGWN